MRELHLRASRRLNKYEYFRMLVNAEYVYSGIDELTRDPSLGSWLDRGMYRWWRICSAIEACCFEGEFTILDVGAFPFTALKVAKVAFPDARLLGAGLWDEQVSALLAEDPLLRDGTFALANLDPWIAVPERLRDVPKDLPFPDGSVDFAIFTEVIEHLYNPAHVLKEIARVLRPGGRLYLTTNNVSYWFYALRLFKGETNLDHDLGQITVDFERDHPHDWRGHVRFYSISQVKEMLRLAGLGKTVTETTYDTTDVQEGAGFAKRVKAVVKGLTNRIPCLRKHRGHLEVVAVKE